MQRPMEFATRLLTALLALSIVACTTVKPIDSNGAEPQSLKIRAGDTVRLSYLNEQIRELRVTDVNEQQISGTLTESTTALPRGAEITANWDEIYAVQGVRFSPLKTAGAAAVVVVAVPLLAVGLMVAGCEETNGC